MTRLASATSTLPSSRRLNRVRRAPAIAIEFDGHPVEAHPGETVATALLAAGISTMRRTSSGAPRGPFCHIGVCFECAVTIDGAPLTRACMVAVRPGMRVETGR